MTDSREINASNLDQVRLGFVKMRIEANKPLLRDTVLVTHYKVNETDQNESVPVITFQPKSKNVGLHPGLLYIHGGGFVAGDAEMNIGYCQSLAEDIGCIVVSVDYRLAPEHPFPAGLEDCYSVLSWMFKLASSLGIDKSKIAIMGESAGGGMAAQLAILLRDRNEYSITLQVLTYPMLDNRTGITINPGIHTGEPIWTKQNNSFGWNSYLVENVKLQAVLPPHPSSPGRIKDLKGLAPVFMAVGEKDILAPECAMYAANLMEQGVPVDFHIYRGASHGFDGVFGTSASQSFGKERNLSLQRAFDSSQNYE
jgi:acetyl esterase/lipase